MSFLFDETSKQKGMSQPLISQFLMCETLLYYKGLGAYPLENFKL